MSRVIQLRLQKYAIETIKTRGPGGLCNFNSNPTTSTKNDRQTNVWRFFCALAVAELALRASERRSGQGGI